MYMKKFINSKINEYHCSIKIIDFDLYELCLIEPFDNALYVELFIEKLNKFKAINLLNDVLLNTNFLEKNRFSKPYKIDYIYLKDDKLTINFFLL